MAGHHLAVAQNNDPVGVATPPVPGLMPPM